jgi:peroxiredoxin
MTSKIQILSTVHCPTLRPFHGIGPPHLIFGMVHATIGPAPDNHSTMHPRLPSIAPFAHLGWAFVFLLMGGQVHQAQGQALPDVSLKDIQGNVVSTASSLQKEGPTVFCFWATWCSPCKRELNNYAELYDDWVDETGVKIVAVSIDDQRSVNRVAPYVNSVGWEYDILLDPNRDFARALNVQNVPHTFVVDAQGNVVWSHNNYAEGDEYELYEELLKLAE